MSTENKISAMVNYLLTCPIVQANPAYFNFGEEKDNAKQMVVLSHDVSVQKPYIDGSVLKKVSFMLFDFRSVTDTALVKTSGYDNENVTDYINSQGIIDWIKSQNDLKNFPNFGTDCVVDSIETTTDTPEYVGVDTSVTPPLARYDTGITVTYLDKSKQLWN